ncbi:hypothetical protein KUTeg_014394 [Tegillarca granosa]|uniref:Globin domain-containing protein n=1 Tax=Tegillarca granosa TaxID=220873 RepID=A0ABQ9F071_TEGGR|nr:hypothetical protein KUTeg_014394 [Tegillarca granosa]
MGCTLTATEPRRVHSMKSEPVSSNAIHTTILEEVKQMKKPEKIKERTSSVLDNRIPLSSRQKFQIVKSWKGIERNIKTTGINMFLRLFEANDEIMQLFVFIGGYKTVTELRESESLVGHVTMVMHTIDEAITSLDDSEYVINMLQSIGKSHKTRLKDFDPNQFWKIEDPFLLAVKETLGDRYTSNMENIYNLTIRFILETLIEGFNLG